VGDDHVEHTAKTLVIATGAQAKWLNIDTEHALKGRGVSACAVCDGAFFRGQDVMVVGGGDTAMEESMYLSGLCKTVTLVHRRHDFRASKTMQERVFKNPKIKVVYDSVVEEVLDVSKGEVTGARLKNIVTNETTVVSVTGLFVAIGHTPNTDLFTGQLDLHDNGYIRTKPGTAQTSVGGRVRVRRRAGLRVSPGSDGGGHGVHGGARGGALVGVAGSLRGGVRGARGPVPRRATAARAPAGLNPWGRRSRRRG